MSQSPSPRRGRFRFLYQFSLRTLLLATAAVAVFCNWYFQPKYHEEELAGKELRQRRQVATGDVKAGQVTTANNYWSQPKTINHGNWSLLDSDSLTLTRGQFVENEATGNWVAYYPTGGKAAEGKLQQGVKVGRWRTWYEDGTLASDVQFTPQPLSRARFVTETKPFYVQIGVPVQRSDTIDRSETTEFIGCRDGRARSWYRSGALQYEGQFKVGLQHGTWTFYDERGHVTESGPFRAGKRHGQWTLTRSVSEGRTSTTHTVQYIDGRTQAELNAILARLKPMLASETRRERYAALIDLANLGEGAAPLLIEWLTHGDAHEQAAILGMVPRMPTGVHLLLPRVRELLAASDERVAHQARLTLFQLDAESRGTLFERLLAEATSAPALGQCLEELTVLYRSDETRRAIVFGRLMELSLHRADADYRSIANAVVDLEGNVTSHFLVACEHREGAVRSQALMTLWQFERGWWPGPSYMRLDRTVREALLARLKKDPMPEVRQMAEEMDQPSNMGGPSGNWGIGSGFTGGSSF